MPKLEVNCLSSPLPDAIMSYRVFKLSFIRGGKQDHVALYVTTSEGSGIIFHARDNPLESTREEIKMKFEEKPFTIATSASVLHDKTVEVGTVKENKLAAFRSVCAQVGNPSGPRLMKNRPNCVTWAENAMYDLNRQGLLELKSGYPVISLRKTLNVPVSGQTKKVQSKAGSSSKK